MTTLHDQTRRGFASDNYAGVHPEVLQALTDANLGHQTAYGDDVYTAHLQTVMARHFGAGLEVFPVFNGTGANVLSLQAMLPRWGGVVCAETAHINVDENGAPERVGGIKLMTVPTPDGKLTPELIDRQAHGFGDEHRAQPLVVSLTQSTELGTLYTPDQIGAVAQHAHSLGMTLHLDGSRISNAAAALGVPMSAFTTDVGVDVLSFGGTKNGLLAAEAIVVLNPDAVVGIKYLRKMNMQLASKMRFFSAQLIALLEGDLWLRSASHANAMAARLTAAAADIDGVTVTRTTEANAVFAVLPRAAADVVRERYKFYDWDAATGEVRWMCAWDTTTDDVDDFAQLLKQALAGYDGRVAF
ncbi:MAG: beta-eliminating lyase-related protein [Nakamurella sp.]